MPKYEPQHTAPTENRASEGWDDRKDNHSTQNSLWSECFGLESGHEFWSTEKLLHVKGEISFFVPGDPATKGSFTGMGRGRMRNASKRTKPWQDHISLVANTKAPVNPIDGPVELHAQFMMKRPLKPKHPEYPIVARGDLDKLLRTVCDALTGIMYHDDGQVVSIKSVKRYEDSGTGVYITVRALT